MQSINFHLKGLLLTFKAFAKGKYFWFLLPGVVTTMLYFWFNDYIGSVKDSSMLSSDYSWINWFYGFLNEGLDKAFGIFSLLTEQLYIFFVLTILSPFNTALAERFDSSFTGNKFEFNLLRVINDFLRMIFVVILLLFLEFMFILIYWMISGIFGLEAFNPIAYYIITAFFIGISFYDFALERYEISVLGTINFGFSNPLSMLLTGSIFTLIYAIPYAGVPISPVIAVMVSTIVYLYITKKLPREKQVLKEETNE